MPKLTQEQINAAKEQGYEGGPGGEPKALMPLPIVPGQGYVYKLVACTSGPAKTNPSKIQWTWEFQLDSRYHPEYVGKGYLEKVWHYTDVSQAWSIAKMLLAFGYSLETETDELINDEATVLAFLVVEEFNGKPKMRARRFAYHDESEYPQVNAQAEEPPFGGDSDPHAPGYQGTAATQDIARIDQALAQEEAKQAAQAPQDDPWATAAPATSAIPPQAAGDPEDTW